MAEEQDKAQKTEDPTPKRREEARQRGQIPTSREVATAALLLVALGVLYLGAVSMGDSLTAAMRDFYRFNDWRGLDADGVVSGLQAVTGHLLAILAPLLVPLVVGAFFVYALQTQMNLSAESIKPKFNKISPAQGIKRIFSMRGLVEFGKSLGKVAVLGGIGYITMLLWWEALLGSPVLTVAQGLGVLRGMVGTVLLLSVIFFLLLAAIDYAFQFQQNEQELRMTKREVQEEHKQTEGDPHMQQRRRQKHQEMSRGRMMEAVPESDVVITNPTHLAIALKYDRSEAPAPQVKAKGKDLMARRIRERAEETGVPVIRRVEVARVLYESAEIGDVIPEELYRIIAEILAWVYDPRHQPRPEGVEAAPGTHRGV
ncbi:flagellar biosynthesis protein FlhB [Thiohalorhabdus methylotrophus]|uniref:Flagellar biosynthetic protein FlhB n=1 Tax=Thiohalorhabdus methylotrophus TaxID=3242694 RepID=A0ABV4TZ90_9GAMM